MTREADVVRRLLKHAQEVADGLERTEAAQRKSRNGLLADLTAKRWKLVMATIGEGHSLATALDRLERPLDVSPPR